MGIGSAIGGIASGIGAVVGASKSSKASSSAAETQSDATIQATELQLEYLRETRADIAEAVESGQIDLDTGFNMAIAELEPIAGMDTYNQALELLQNPESVFDRPGIQYQYDQGMEALNARLSKSTGGGISGPGMKAAMEYGQNFAASALDQELARLSPFIDRSIAAKTNIANLYSGLGTSKANLGVGGAGQIAGVTGQVIPAVASGIQQMGNYAATNQINQANISTNLMSNLSKTVSDMGMMYDMKKYYSNE